jgi:soluble lytic murein transglycosylase-like protein
MRGVGHTRSRLPGARALLAGLALLAGAFVPAAAQATGNEQTAFAVPRIGPVDSNDEVALPQPLSPSDAVLARRAFALQAHGMLAAADQSIAEMQDTVLLGTLQAERYLGRYHRATAAELTDWLGRYAAQPDAAAIRALLVRRLPNGAAVPPLPAPPPTPSAAPAAPAAGQAPDAPRIARQPALEHVLAERLQRGGAQAALHLVASRHDLAPPYAGLLRGEIVRALFTRNDDAEALSAARIALGETPPAGDVGLAAYVGGLAAWRLHRLTEARWLFHRSAEAAAADPQQRAAAAYWSARAAERLHDTADARRWLERAAVQRTTLHGLIARRLLGLPTGIAPSGDLLSQADVDAIAATDAGWRAFALLQVGQPARAAAELRGLFPAVRDDPPLRRALLLVAAGVGLTDCAAELAAWAEAADPDADDAAQAALPPLHPAGGFRVDKALVYALTRVESNFDADAVSSAGARGLMQLMPVTAQYVASNAALDDSSLHDPALNLELGQRYVLALAADDAIDGNLIRLLASYNAGPGGFLHWSPSVRDEGDPLLFIEAIPTTETRHFVARALTYTWLYAARLHVPAPSLDQMAAGDFPRFTPGGVRGRIVSAALH